MAHDRTHQLAQSKTADGPRPGSAPAAASGDGHGGEEGQAGGGESGTAPVPEVILEEDEEYPSETEEEELAEDFDLTPTAAIDVPGQPQGEMPPFAGEYHSAQGEYFDQSSLAKYMSEHSSISFDPQVRMDDGAQQALGAPLPKLAIKTRPRGRSLLEEMQKREMQRQLSRARSETDREEYDPETGERLDLDREGQRDPRYVAHQPRWPFLQSTVDDLARHQSHEHVLETPPPSRQSDRHPSHSASSLTSGATASSTTEPATRTPAALDTAVAAAAAVAETVVLSPVPFPSPPSQSDWDGPASVDRPRQITAALRSKSFGQERRSWRRTSRRSTSNSISPASAFLSRYHYPQSPPTAPDGEGQEVGDYVLGREIGFGGFSTIREASTIADGQRVSRAVKIVRRQVAGKGEAENETLQAEYDHEVALWRCLAHDNILPLFAVWETDFATFAFTHLNTGGTLFDAVRKNRAGLPPALCRRYAYQVASALRYLHEDMRIVHRDIKLENCLVDVSDPELAALGGKILLCDFGLADYMSSEDSASAASAVAAAAAVAAVAAATSHPPSGSKPASFSPGAAGDASALAQVIGPSGTSTNIAGSLPYAAPEMLLAAHPLLTPHPDIWAFGVVCYAMLVGRLPFQHAFAPRVRMMILSGDFDDDALNRRERGFQAALEEGGKVWLDRGESREQLALLEGAGELVLACLEKVPKKRWDVHACLHSQWLWPEMDVVEGHGGWVA